MIHFACDSLTHCHCESDRLVWFVGPAINVYSATCYRIHKQFLQYNISLEHDACNTKFKRTE